MKIRLLFLPLLLMSLISFGQAPVTPLTAKPPVTENDSTEPEEKKGFDPNRLVIGGNLGAGFGNYTFVNVTPQVGYMFNQYITAGVGINYLYNSYKYSNGDRDSYNFAGVNLFARFFPIRFLYISAQPEIDYSWGKYKFGDYTTEPDYKYDGKWVPAVLVGAGAVLSPNGKGGIYFGVQYDLIQNDRSPYGTHPYLNIGFGF